MSASDHLQLKLFMSPREIGQTVSHYGDWGPNTGGLPHENPKAGFKLQTAKHTGMAASIARDGVKHPVALEHFDEGARFVNGHHRLAVQSSVDPDRLMPVKHWEGWSDDTFRGDVTQQEDPTGDRK